MTATPYDAKHVIYRDSGHMVHALWAANPEHARQLADPTTPEEVINRLWFRDDVEIVATATRHYKRDGAGFSGWVIECMGDPTDSIRTKREAVKQLRMAVADYFKR
jgi:5'(3')-deoxyribonucleotidase